MSLSKAQIGRCGELLVQFMLLKHGIDSSPLTTDVGVDLVAYSPRQPRAVTVQVKTNLTPKPGGGKGKPALDWWVKDELKADIFAFVDLKSPRVWLVKSSELESLSQQHPAGRFHLYMAVDRTQTPRKDRKKKCADDFHEYLFKNRVAEIFG